MDFGHLFTSFDGRINRQRFWIGVGIMIVVAIVLSLILTALLGVAGPRGASMAGLLVGLLMLYPWLALGVKRFHDRGKPGWLMAIVVAPALISQLGDVLGLTSSVQMIGGEMIPVPNVLGWLLILATLVVAIWAIIELGIRKGTEGPNEYGPDPLAKV